jgi:hypothetical protein
MIINRANMDSLFQTFMTKFNDAQKASAGRAEMGRLMAARPSSDKKARRFTVFFPSGIL